MIMAAVCLLAGCGTASVPERNTVSVQKDGTIRQTIVDQFEQNYYDAGELEAMAQEKIGRYGGGSGTIVCNSVKADDGDVIVQMTYQAGADYTAFNKRELFCGTVEEAAAQGYSLQDLVKEDGTAIGEDGISAISANHIIIIETKAGEEMAVNVYDKILYTSGDVTISGKKDVMIPAGETDLLSCIVFR